MESFKLNPEMKYKTHTEYVPSWGMSSSELIVEPSQGAMVGRLGATPVFMSNQNVDKDVPF